MEPSESMDAAPEKPPKSDTGFDSPMIRKSGFFWGFSGYM